MADTIREKIILEILARAAAIRITSPAIYGTDIGATVYRARTKIDPSALPCVVVWPLPEEADNTHGQVTHVMPVKIEGIAAFGATDPSIVAERILGDLIRCFTSPSWDRRRPQATSPVTYLAPYAESIIYKGGGTDSYPEDGALTVGAYANFDVTYWTAIGDPTA